MRTPDGTGDVTDIPMTTVDPQALLVRLAGADAKLRDDQRRAIDALVEERRRVLLVQATGWGKSAVYWIAAAMLRAAGRGPTLVVSPLLALMRDQVEAARRAGLVAHTINSTNPEAWDDILGRLDADDVDVLLISPERLNAATFRPRLGELASRLGMLVVDEAHCISDWGHDFRPDYRRVADVLVDLDRDVAVLACTATANDRVVADVAATLDADTLTLRGRLSRPSLQLAVVRLPDAQTRLGWLSGFLARHRPVHGRAGVVYTLTVDDAHRTAEFLARHGHEVAAYSSRLEPDERTRVEDDLAANRLDAVVATSALGMGYDKPDMAFVVHVGAPSSPVAYYQQIGRAGRAIDTAEIVLLPTAADERIWVHFDLAQLPTRAETDAVLRALDTAEPLSLPSLETRVNASRTRLETLLKILDVEGAAERVRGGYVATGRPYRHDGGRYARLADARRREHEVMRRLSRGEVEECLLAYIAAQLDDPDPAPCGRCQTCAGFTPDPEIDPAVVADAATFLRSRDIPLPPRRRWPARMDEVKGAIARERCAQVGRALSAGDDSGWSDVVDPLLEQAATGEVDEALLERAVGGLVKILARWDWATRPRSVAWLDDDRHALLARLVAERLGALGRLPVVEALELVGSPPDPPPSNSAHQASDALARVRTTGRPVPDGPVLLVVAERGDGWDLTVAAWRLTGDGARGVLPLVLRRGR